jgi:hypothetical protein
LNAQLAGIAARVDSCGFAFVPQAEMLSLLPQMALDDWSQFAATWNQLGPDGYMADGGRYRRRRYAVYRLKARSLERQPHQPHYQSRDYNRLNGGIQRWFEPVTEAAAQNPVTLAMLELCQMLFSGLETNAARERHVEMHQFRIEPAADETSYPTPEGMHRDGVEWVCVLLVGRSNVEDGVTQVHDHQGRELGAFTLSNPLDTVFLDDRRVLHGVTGVQRIDSYQAGFRDVFVVTFSGPGGPAAAR